MVQEGDDNEDNVQTVKNFLDGGVQNVLWVWCVPYSACGTKGGTAVSPLLQGRR